MKLCPYSLTTIVTHDIDELASVAKDWDQTYQQISPGRFTGKITDICFKDIQLYRESYSQAVYGRGGCTRDTYLFGLSVSPQGNILHCGQPATDQNLLTAVGGSEINIRIPGDLIVLAVDATALHQYAETLEGRDIRPLFKSNKVFASSPAQTRQLGRYLATTLEQFETQPKQLESSQTQTLLQASLFQHLMAVLEPLQDNSIVSSATSTQCNHTQIFAKVKDYIVAHETEPMMVADLCSVIGINRRQLENTFQTMVGMTPGKYLRTHRFKPGATSLTTG